MPKIPSLQSAELLDQVSRRTLLVKIGRAGNRLIAFVAHMCVDRVTANPGIMRMTNCSVHSLRMDPLLLPCEEKSLEKTNFYGIVGGHEKVRS